MWYMYIYIYKCVCIYIHIYIHIHIDIYTFISIVRSGQLLIIHQSATLGASFVVRALELIQHAYIYLYNTYGYNTYPYLSIYTYTHKPFISDITRETNHGSTSNHLLTLVLVVKHGNPELWIGNSSSSGWSWIFLLAVFDSQREYHFEWLPKMDMKPQESAPFGPTDIFNIPDTFRWHHAEPSEIILNVINIQYHQPSFL